jgi:hypothetical protein
MLHLGDPRGAGLGRPLLRRLWLPLPSENSRPPPLVGPYRGAGNSERHELLATCYLGTEFCPMRAATGRGRRKQHGREKLLGFVLLFSVKAVGGKASDSSRDHR